MNALTQILILTFCIIASFSQAKPIATQPQPKESFKLNKTRQQNDEVVGCSYTVTIKTSCSSSMYARELIGLLFGDAHGNQVYVPRLEGPNGGVFERCSTDTYEIYGPCTYPICHLYLHRTGDFGWIPETVSVYNYFYDPVTFYYGTYIPEGGPYGFDDCDGF